MKPLLPALMSIFAFFPGGLNAEIAVVTDIPPVHSLVSQVTQGVGTPSVLLTEAVSVHDFALKPSQARQIQDSDLVIWVGPTLAPQLSDAISSLGRGAEVLVLEDVSGVIHREVRDEAVFAEDGGEDHGHTHHEEHDHSGDDPHLWLDPENAKVWVRAIAQTLSTLEPLHAETYAANADRAIDDLASLQESVQARLEDKAPSFVVSHDSLIHFEARFGVHAIGALAESDAVAPGPRRVAAIRSALEAQSVSCLLVDVSDGTELMSSLLSEDRSLVEIDVVGATLTPGPALYGELIESLSKAVSGCVQE